MNIAPLFDKKDYFPLAFFLPITLTLLSITDTYTLLRYINSYNHYVRSLQPISSSGIQSGLRPAARLSAGLWSTARISTSSSTVRRRSSGLWATSAGKLFRSSRRRRIPTWSAWPADGCLRCLQSSRPFTIFVSIQNCQKYPHFFLTSIPVAQPLPKTNVEATAPQPNSNTLPSNNTASSRSMGSNNSTISNREDIRTPTRPMTLTLLKARKAIVVSWALLGAALLDDMQGRITAEATASWV